MVSNYKIITLIFSLKCITILCDDNSLDEQPRQNFKKIIVKLWKNNFSNNNYNLFFYHSILNSVRMLILLIWFSSKIEQLVISENIKYIIEYS